MIFFTHASEGLAHTFCPLAVVKLQHTKQTVKLSKAAVLRVKVVVRLAHLHDGGAGALLAGHDVALHSVCAQWLLVET